jgi:hypothetical protein
LSSIVSFWQSISEISFTSSILLSLEGSFTCVPSECLGNQ